MSAIIEQAMQRAQAGVAAAAEPATPPLAEPAAQPGPLSVRLLGAESADRARWDAFVQACPEATFFHRAGWQRVIEEAFGHRTWFFLAERDGHIEGVLPLAQIKSRLFGHALIALPFCVYGGVAAHTGEARAALDAEALRLAGSLNVGHLEYRNYTPAHPDDAAWLGKDLYVTFRKEISGDDEANMNAIPRKQRAMVRKGIKLGLTGEVDQDVERFFTAYANSVHRLGTPVFSKKYFRLLKEEFGDDCEVRVIVQGEGSDKRLVAGVLSFFFRDEVLPYYGGGMPLARDVAGNDFMYWNLMQASAAKGYRIFDFGRSKRGTGAFDFKKNWGFVAQPLPYEYRLVASHDLPDVNPLNPKYQLFIKLWQKLPLPLANVLGPHIVKDLG
ncbi:FemAB family PEP-CTERM system-associated protein [Pseudoduganella sp. SL102]|uniref:FemAB family XrtA/PEP-CTERM system-associated protein n=1 Tax=Pseudoduganella sp. SL102 TaxID=2995154 RepID=UPI00248B668B|nr:FemAB family XrtA/PEP-CTERM system-associated protein [Pseudoduganella sp. SL102]WBS03249.1 FemAB family PEP-CTERM system-associated protein [Pseudoduganella sp. SL102]